MTRSEPARESTGLPRPPWAAREQARRRVLTGEAIVAVALDLAAREGTDAVTMRRVAGELGVAASSLYAHVQNREQLLQLAVHEVMDRVGSLPDTGDWRADLRAYFVQMRRELSRHGDLVRHAFADTALPSGEDDLVELERVMARLVAAGIDPRTAAWGFDRLLLLTVADVYETWRFAQKDRATREWLAALRDFLRGLPVDRYPTLSEHAGLIVDSSPEDRFGLGIDLVLDGMAARVR